MRVVRLVYEALENRVVIGIFAAGFVCGTSVAQPLNCLFASVQDSAERGISAVARLVQDALAHNPRLVAIWGPNLNENTLALPGGSDREVDSSTRFFLHGGLLWARHDCRCFRCVDNRRRTCLGPTGTRDGVTDKENEAIT